MLALSLGVAWLVLAPLCLWLLAKGSNGERVGAIVTLALLEGGTIAMDAVLPHPAPTPPLVVAHALPPTRPSCTERIPAPESAQVGEGLVLTWAAAPRECRTAHVVVRSEGRKLLVWLHESPGIGERKTVMTLRHRSVLTLPVRVEGGIATLTIPRHEKSGYIPINGRTGRRIPKPATSVSNAVM
ncbi:hypothetical protein ACFLIM_07110 [Nonomuraea sp. M3C6]|uniref:Uncharacterized protein n=1 Tax=Nonomuraea marmarensis TaxID=3351344 RepID=A0ABW7A9G5_9ACTN